MGKVFLTLLLVTAAALSVASQSGRRVTTPRTTAPAPVQPPLNPEPEINRSHPNQLEVAIPAGESPRRQIKTLDSGSFRFSDFQGKVVVINLWASWCGPCRREVPEYEKVRNAYAGRRGGVHRINDGRSATSSDRVKKFLRDVSFGFRLGWADRETARTLMNGENGIPQTLVLDPAGRVVNHWSGYSPGSTVTS